MDGVEGLSGLRLVSEARILSLGKAAGSPPNPVRSEVWGMWSVGWVLVLLVLVGYVLKRIWTEKRG